MQLLYIWIESYHNIKNQGFNFSSEYLIDFDHVNKVLNINPNPNFIPEFFGDFISNITAIVGENGTGKSSVLEMKNVCFYLLKNENSFSINALNESYNELVIKGLDICIKKEKSNDRYDNVLFVKYNPMFEGRRYDRNYRPIFEEKRNGWNIDCHDISTDEIFNNNLFVNPHSEDNYVSKYNIYETFSQLEFIFEGFKLPYKMPNELAIFFPLHKKFERFKKEITDRIQNLKLPFSPYSPNLSDEENNRELTLHENYHKRLKKEINTFEKIIDNCNNNIIDIKQQIENSEEKQKKEFENKMAISQLMWTAVFEFFNSYPTQGNREFVGDYDDFSVEYPDTPISEWFYDFFERGLKKYLPSVRTGKYDEEVKAWKNLPIMIREIDTLLNIGYIIAFYTGSYGNSDWEFSKCGFKIPLDDDSKYPILKKTFINTYKSIIWVRSIQTYGFLDFEWRGISSGERMLLSLFARINSTCRFMDSHSKINSVVLIIDEGEIGFHPEWQRNYITRLIQTLPIIYQNTNVKSIQIILSTHSPFILSDLPNSNVIFLEKDNDGNCKVANKNPLQDRRMTFGANIHSLLADGFFMKNGLIGDFAKQKINDLIDDLIGSKPLTPERNDEIIKTIPIIGEPIIRKKVMDLFNEKSNLNVESKIEDLQRQIDELKSLK